MATFVDAELWIGGEIPQSLVPELCAVIAGSGARQDWGEASFTPATADELVEALQDVEGVLLLRVCDDEARHGQFAELEAFLEQHGISYDRRSNGVLEYDPDFVQYRPGMTCPRDFPCNVAGQRVVLHSAAKAALAQLEAGNVQQAQQALQKLVGADVPPLQPFVLHQGSPNGAQNPTPGGHEAAEAGAASLESFSANPETGLTQKQPLIEPVNGILRHINRVLEINSCHVPYSDTTRFARCSHFVGEFSGGWLFHLDVGDDGAIVLEPETTAAIEPLGLSEPFVDLLRLAASAQCFLLRIHQVGEVYADLPRFEW